MRELWAVAVKDATESWRDGRVRVLALLVAGLTVVAGAAGWARTAALDRERADARRAERDRWLDQQDVNPHAAAHYGTFVFRPVEPLAAFDPGLEPFVGAAVFLEAHQQQLARHRPIDDAAPIRRLGMLSAALCFQVLVPLLVVLLTFGSIAGERERGTWRLVLGSGLGVWRLGAGKALGAALPLAGVLGVPAVAGLAAVVSVSPDALDGAVAARAAMLALAYATYLVTWLAFGLAVSASARSSRAALLTLLVAWLAVCVVAPPLAMAAATWRHETPSAASFDAAIADERAARPTWDERVDEATERFLAGEDLPPASNPEVVALIETEEDDTDLYARHFDALAEVFAAQSGVYRRAGLFAPMLAVQSISMAMAGTDYAHARHFLEAAASYRTTLLRALNGELARFDGWRTFNAAGSRELWAGVPEFDYDTPGAAWAVRGQASSFVALGVWLAASIVAAGVGLSRAAA